MKNEIKEQALVGNLPVIQSPELIKVKTISPKIVEQMPWIGVNSSEWLGHEIIGRLPTGGVIVLRHATTGKLSRMADMAYLDTRAKELEAQSLMAWPQASEQANAELRALPQIFAV
jgi:hypothetical protein